MPNARQASLIASPSSSRATNRRRSSITEHSFHGIQASPGKGKGVTHVSGTICHLCLGPLKERTVCRGQGSSPPERECRASGSVRRVPSNEHPYRNRPDAGALFLEAAGKADPFVLHRLVMAIHVVEGDRQP